MFPRFSFSRMIYALGILTCIVLTICLLFSIEVYYVVGNFRLSPAWNEGLFVVPVGPPFESENCKEHHIAMVLGGYSVVHRASALFKSILYHHRGPLVFHFITDRSSREVLPTLFDTWDLPSVRYHTYDMDKYKSRVDWIPNGHYSAVFGLIKLIIPDIVPEDVEEVLLLDSDLVVLNDLTPIFNSFKGTNSSALFAMAENISPWYTQGTPTNRRWPARGRGFNSGVVLIHSARMRKANWNKMWRDETELRLKEFGKVHLADQDIFNVLTVSNPNMIVELPCEYNFQLGGQSQPAKCQQDDRFVKIAHFNSPQKMKLKSKWVVHYAQDYAVYQSMDGYIFRLRNECFPDNVNATLLSEFTDEKDSDCGALFAAINTKYRTHLYFNGYKAPKEPLESGDVTLVTQFSVDRFDIFQKVLDSWEGPVSAVVYCTDAEMAQIGSFMQASQIAKGRINVAMHAVFKTGTYYPINYLRNVALNASKTDFAYLADVDFIPSKYLYTSLRELLKTAEMNKKALVIPAFEISSTERIQFPETKEELLEDWDEGKVQPFRTNIWPAGHNATDYEQWRDSEESYEVQWQPGYEPYAVIARNSTPLYDERFVGFGWNKVSHLMSLHAEGFKFEVVPDGFTVHHPHPPSFEISRYRGSSLYRKCMRLLRNEFARDLHFQRLAQQAVATAKPRE
ncbi:hypothetical protein PFISCL1PPCAC_26987 [Pristionchus fissidentatus]|uniref:Uncharacterized protein n=1 Tax=Pristionchus fissidentatus TaxID=1538716 RepID=A0AAV5WVZ8_9BILA|nr:hypothetical protein PFISCL1PPCAC_26987 [Pristionchus fissidentatus]